MVTTPFLKPGTVGKIHSLIRRGHATVQSLQGNPVVTIIRDGAAVPALTNVPVISLVRDNTQEQGSPPNQGAGEIRLTGTLTAWYPFGAKVDDRFLWEGMWCVITTAPPSELGIVDLFGFDILQSGA